jgi:CrcB protein
LEATVNRAANASLILVGGMAGTVVRASLEAGFAAAAGTWPWATFAINISGSLALGVLLELLAGFDDDGWRRSVRLGVGTGFFGGFTTYSSFSLETVALLRNGDALLGIGYAVSSVTLGIAAALVAMLGVRRLRTRASQREAT